MSLHNATLRRIDAPPPPKNNGQSPDFVPGPPIAVRCILDQPTFYVQQLVDNLKLKSSHVLYVKLKDYPNGPQDLVTGAQVLVQMDGGEPLLRGIDDGRLCVNGGASHVQCLVDLW